MLCRRYYDLELTSLYGPFWGGSEPIVTSHPLGYDLLLFGRSHSVVAKATIRAESDGS
jgi:hypothetical protein